MLEIETNFLYFCWSAAKQAQQIFLDILFFQKIASIGQQNPARKKIDVAVKTV